MLNTGDEIIKLMNTEGQKGFMVDGEAVPIISLSPAALGRIQLKYGVKVEVDTGEVDAKGVKVEEAMFAAVAWSDLIRFPLNRLDVAEALLRACAEKAGKTDPGEITDAEDLIRRYVTIPTDLPEMPEVPGDDLDEAPDPTPAS